MAKKIDKSSLNYLGDEAQMKLVKSLIEDKELFANVYPILNESQFTEPNLIQIVKYLKTFYSQTMCVPSYKDIEIFLKETAKDQDSINKLRSVFVRLRGDELNDGQKTATDACVETLKRNEALRVLKNGIRSIDDNGYSTDKIARISDGLQNIEKTADEGEAVMAYDLIDRVFSTTPSQRIPTGIKELDEQMKGGLPKKNIGLLIAGTGVGKTTMGSIICCNAAIAGYRVLHIFFEDTVEDIGKKYYSNITHRYTSDYTSVQDREKYKGEILGDPKVNYALRNNLLPCRMKNSETSVDDIKNFAHKLVAVKGWKPDMIFIDYISCLRTSTDSRIAIQNEFQALERCMKRIEAFSQDEDIAIWVAQQTNRDAFKEETSANQRIGNVQGSFRLTQPASFILYLNRNNSGGDINRANLYLDKCRGCEPKKWENIYLNNGNMEIDLSGYIGTDTKEELEWKDEQNNLIDMDINNRTYFR